MDAIDIVNRVFREFRRYTGDGLPNEPAGAPLPVGDPSSGPHSPKKSELRSAFHATLDDVSAYVDQASEYADQARGWAEAAAEIAIPAGSITAGMISDDPEELRSIRNKIGAATGGSLSLALALSEANETYFAGGDIYADGFKSIGMIDVAGATALDTSEAGYLKPTATGEVYATTADPTVAGDAAAGSQSNNANRYRIPASAISTSGDRVKVTFRASASGPLHITQAYVGHTSGAAGNFDGTQVPLTFSGSTSVTIAAGATLESDAVAYGLDQTKDFTVALDHGSSSTNSFNLSATGYKFYSKSSVSEAANTTISGYAETLDVVACVDLIRVRTSPGVAANLSVASQTVPSRSPVNGISGELRVVPIDALTLNTDLILDVSRSDGGAWTAATLELFFQDGGTSVLRFDEVDLSAAAAGSAVRYRIRSANNKNFKADGVALGISE